MKAKSKGLLYAENDYLKNTLLFYISAIKEAGIEFKSEIQFAPNSFTEYHKTKIGQLMLCYNLERLFDLKGLDIAHEINESVNKEVDNENN